MGLQKVRDNMQRRKEEVEKKKKKQEKDTEKRKTMVVIPYVQGLSESVDRVMRKHGDTTAMRPHCTLRSLLVHPKKIKGKKQRNVKELTGYRA